MRKMYGILFTLLLAVLFALPALSVADSETVNGVVYTYTVENGRATITDAEFQKDSVIVIPNELGGMPVTAIQPEAFKNLAQSITLPDTLLELRGDELDYGDGDEGYIQSLTIPGKGTLVYPQAISSILSDNEVRAYKDSMAARWAKLFNIENVVFLDGEEDYLSSAEVSVDGSIKRGWEIDISGSAAEDFYYPNTTDGFRFTIEGAQPGDTWYAWDLFAVDDYTSEEPHDLLLLYEGTVGTDGFCVLNLDTRESWKENWAPYEMIFFYKHEGEYSRVDVKEEEEGWLLGWQISPQERSDLPAVEHVTVSIPGDADAVTVGSETTSFTVSFDAVENAARYVIEVGHDSNNGEPEFALNPVPITADGSTAYQHTYSVDPVAGWMSGKYNVRVIAYADEATLWSQGKTNFNVVIEGELEKPEIDIKYQQFKGENFTFRFSGVAGATGYTAVVLQRDDDVDTPIFTVPEGLILNDEEQGWKTVTIPAETANEWATRRYILCITATDDSGNSSKAYNNFLWDEYVKLPAPELTPESQTVTKGETVKVAFELVAYTGGYEFHNYDVTLIDANGQEVELVDQDDDSYLYSTEEYDENDEFTGRMMIEFPTDSLDAGTYTLSVVTWTGDEKFLPSDAALATITVKNHLLTEESLQLVNEGFVYGNDISLTLVELPADVSYQVWDGYWEISDVDGVWTLTYSTENMFLDIGDHLVTIRVLDNNTYKYIATETVTIKVKAAESGEDTLEPTIITLPTGVKANDINPFEISWEAVEGAEEYRIDIYREMENPDTHVMGTWDYATNIRVNKDYTSCTFDLVNHKYTANGVEHQEGIHDIRPLREGEATIRVSAVASGKNTSRATTEMIVAAPEEGREFGYYIDEETGEETSDLFWIYAAGELTIDETHNGQTVCLAGGALTCSGVTVLHIPGSVRLEDQPFWGAWSLTDIWLDEDFNAENWDNMNLEDLDLAKNQAVTWHVYKDAGYNYASGIIAEQNNGVSRVELINSSEKIPLDEVSVIDIEEGIHPYILNYGQESTELDLSFYGVNNADSYTAVLMKDGVKVAENSAVSQDEMTKLYSVSLSTEDPLTRGSYIAEITAYPADTQHSASVTTVPVAVYEMLAIDPQDKGKVSIGTLVIGEPLQGTLPAVANAASYQMEICINDEENDTLAVVKRSEPAQAVVGQENYVFSAPTDGLTPGGTYLVRLVAYPEENSYFYRSNDIFDNIIAKTRLATPILTPNTLSVTQGNPAVFAFATNENAANYTAVLKKNDTEVDAAEPVVGEGTVSVATGTLEAGTYSLTLTANAETGENVVYVDSNPAAATFTVEEAGEDPTQPHTVTVDGVTYTYTVSEGTATIIKAEYRNLVPIVIPDRLPNTDEGALVTAIDEGVFTDPVPSSITLPSGLLELRGDELNYWDNENWYDEYEMESLIIPGKGTLVHPSAIESLPWSVTIRSFERSMTAVWAEWFDKSFEPLSQTLPAVTGIPGDNDNPAYTIENPVDYHDGFKITPAGFRIKLNGATAGDEWAAMQIVPDIELYTGQVGTDGYLTLVLPTGVVGDERQILLTYKHDGEWRQYVWSWTGDEGDQHPFYLSVEAKDTLDPSSITVSTGVKANGTGTYSIFWTKVEDAESYTLEIDKEAADPDHEGNRRSEGYVEVPDIPADATSCEIYPMHNRIRVQVNGEWQEIDGWCDPLIAGTMKVRLTAKSETKNHSRATEQMMVDQPDSGREFEYEKAEDGDYRIIYKVYSSGEVTIPARLDADASVVLWPSALSLSEVTTLRIAESQVVEDQNSSSYGEMAGVGAWNNAFEGAWSLQHIWLPRNMYSFWPEEWEDLGFAESQAITWHVYEGTDAYTYAQQMVAEANNGSEVKIIGEDPGDKTPLSPVTVTNIYEDGSIHFVLDYGYIDIFFMAVDNAESYTVALMDGENTLATKTADCVLDEDGQPFNYLASFQTDGLTYGKEYSAVITAHPADSTVFSESVTSVKVVGYRCPIMNDEEVNYDDELVIGEPFSISFPAVADTASYEVILGHVRQTDDLYFDDINITVPAVDGKTEYTVEIDTSGLTRGVGYMLMITMTPPETDEYEYWTEGGWGATNDDGEYRIFAKERLTADLTPAAQDVVKGATATLTFPVDTNAASYEAMLTVNGETVVGLTPMVNRETRTVTVDTDNLTIGTTYTVSLKAKASTEEGVYFVDSEAATATFSVTEKPVLYYEFTYGDKISVVLPTLPEGAYGYEIERYYESESSSQPGGSGSVYWSFSISNNNGVYSLTTSYNPPLGLHVIPIKVLRRGEQGNSYNDPAETLRYQIRINPLGKLATPNVQKVIDTNGYAYGWDHSIEFEYDWGLDAEFDFDTEDNCGFAVYCEEDKDNNIEGYTWNDGKCNEIYLNGFYLKPGEYTCSIKAFARGYEDSDPAEFTIKILPLGNVEYFDRFSGWKFTPGGEHVGVWHYRLTQYDKNYYDEVLREYRKRIDYSYSVLDENGAVVDDEPIYIYWDYDYLEEDRSLKMYAVAFDQYYWQKGKYNLQINAHDYYLNVTSTTRIPFEIVSDPFLYGVNEDGTVTLTLANYADGAEVVVPDTLGGKPVTAIAADAFPNVPKSITLPSGLLELRGDELSNYAAWAEDSDDDDEPTSWVETLIIPGKATMVYPKAVEYMQDGATVVAYADSIAERWARDFDKEFRSFEDYAEYGVTGSLEAASVTVSSEVARGWELGIYDSIAEDYFYPTKAQGFPVTLSGSGTWYAWDLEAWRSANEDDEHEPAKDAGLITLGAVNAHTFTFAGEETVDPNTLKDLDGEYTPPHHEYIFFYKNAEGSYSKIAVWDEASGMGYPVMIRKAPLAKPALTLSAESISQGRTIEATVSGSADAAGYEIAVSDSSGNAVAFDPALSVEGGKATIPTVGLTVGETYTVSVIAKAVADSDYLDSEAATKAFIVTAKPKLATPVLTPKTQSVVTGSAAQIDIMEAENAETYEVTLTDGSGVETSVKPIAAADAVGDWSITVETDRLAAGTVYTLNVTAKGGSLYSDSAAATAKIMVMAKTALAKPVLTMDPKTVVKGAADNEILISFAKDANASGYDVAVKDADGTAKEFVLNQETATYTITVNTAGYEVGAYNASVIAKTGSGSAYIDSAPAEVTFTVTEPVTNDGNTYQATNLREEEKKVTLTEISSEAIGDDGSVTIVGTFTQTTQQGGTTTETTYIVTEIGANVLPEDSKESVTSVSIPDTVISIGESAFAGASNLNEVTIPETVTTIGASAFEGTAVTDIDLSNTGVTEVGDGVFKDATNLTSVTLHPETTAIGAGAFENAGADGNGIDEIVIPAKVETLGDGAFNGTNVETVTVASTELAVTSAAVFEGMNSDTTLRAPEGSLAEYFYNSSHTEHYAVATEDCVLPPAVDASLNTVDGKITPSDDVLLSISNVSANADYVVIVEDGSNTEIVESRGIRANVEVLSSRRALMRRGTDEGLTISLRKRSVGDYTIRYTINENNGEGWTQLAAKNLTVTSEDETVLKNEDLIYDTNGIGLTVKGTKEGTDAVVFAIPEKFTQNDVEYTVTAIAANAFTGSGLSITIPKTLVKIEDNAFPKDAKITTPKHGPAWFYGKKNAWTMTEDETITVKTFTLPAALTKLSVSALMSTGAECVILPEGCKVESGAFADCDNLRVVAFRGTAGTLDGGIFGSGDSADDGVLLVNANNKEYQNVLDDVAWAD